MGSRSSRAPRISFANIDLAICRSARCVGRHEDTANEQLLNDNKIAEVLVGSDTIQGTLKEPFPDGRKLFSTTRVDPEVAGKITAPWCGYGRPSSNFLSTILSWVLPIFIFYLICTYRIRRMADRQGFGGRRSISIRATWIRVVSVTTGVDPRRIQRAWASKVTMEDTSIFPKSAKIFCWVCHIQEISVDTISATRRSPWHVSADGQS